MSTVTPIQTGPESDPSTGSAAPSASAGAVVRAIPAARLPHSEKLPPVSARGWQWGRLIRWLLGAELFLLLALAQMMFAGYRLGVGNQSIQIPFLRHWIDPQLYANDEMFRRTLAAYPSFFFKLLAVVVGRMDLFAVYFWLHVLTTATVLGAAYRLARAMFDSRGAAIVLVLMLLGGHHHALAGEDLYSLGFTHTWAVFPLAIAALALLYRGHHLLAFALVGLIFNLHALTAGYLLVMFMTWAAFEVRRPGVWWRVPFWLGVFAVLAMPTAIDMLRHKQAFTGQWLELTRLRSADHSFPSTWWAAGNPDLPRFALLGGLAALAMSFVTDRRARSMTLLLVAGAGALFVAGVVFTEIWPVPTVVRAQLFRASRLVMVLGLAHTAYGVARAWKLSGVGALFRRREDDSGRGDWRGSAAEPPPASARDLALAHPHGGTNGYPVPGAVTHHAGVNATAALSAALVPAWARALEVLVAGLVFVTVAVPGMMAWAPWVLLAGLVLALATGRLAWWQAAAGAVSLLIALAAWRSIDYHIPGLGETAGQALKKAWEGLATSAATGGPVLAMALVAAAAAVLFLRLPVGPRAKLCALVAIHFVCVVAAMHGYRHLAYAGVSKADPWVATQLWASKNTPVGALFLTPPQQGGFRVHSGRSVVCEWRDGTQLYFSADFTQPWWDRLRALRPIIYDAAGGREIGHGRLLEEMGDREIVALARQYGATHVVLPAGVKRELSELYTNDRWAVYVPEILSAEEKFFKYTVLPNVEQNRRSDVRLDLLDDQGRPLNAGEYQVVQTRQAFGFGCSIPPFEPIGGWQPEWVSPVVTEKQLKLFKEAGFNYSMIPFSGKWNTIEETQGQRDYAELDKYVDFCSRNGIEMEFHYLSGFIPPWARQLPADARKQAWYAYCRETVARYQDRIKYWQIVNDAYQIDYASELIKEFRAKYPHLKWGISDCQAFYAPRPELTQTLRKGLPEVQQMDAEGARLDFFSTHAHKPNGVWPDPRTIYECLDMFAREGVKVHATELTLDLRARVLGDVAKAGEPWTPELQAEFFEQYYTVLFSHPAVEAINYWDLGYSNPRDVAPGPGRGMFGGRPAIGQGSAAGGPPPTGQAGLLDPTRDFEPRPLYHRLKQLITEKWMTRLSGKLEGGNDVTFRGFHGQYQVTLTTPDGKKLKGAFAVKPGGTNTVQVKMAGE